MTIELYRTGSTTVSSIPLYKQALLWFVDMYILYYIFQQDRIRPCTSAVVLYINA